MLRSLGLLLKNCFTPSIPYPTLSPREGNKMSTDGEINIPSRLHPLTESSLKVQPSVLTGKNKDVNSYLMLGFEGVNTHSYSAQRVNMVQQWRVDGVRNKQQIYTRYKIKNISINLVHCKAQN